MSNPKEMYEAPADDSVRDARERVVWLFCADCGGLNCAVFMGADVLCQKCYDNRRIEIAHEKAVKADLLAGRDAALSEDAADARRRGE